MESSRRGISLLDLFNLPPGTQALLPDNIAAPLEALAVLDHRATTSPDTFAHHGLIQSVGEGLALPGLRDWLVEIPGVNTGVPFQLIFTRAERAAPAPGEALEPAPDSFQLDLFLDRFAITIPGLQPARVEETPGGPTHLVRDRTRDKVKLVGGAIFRLRSAPDGISAQFVDAPDPLDPQTPTGFVAGLTFDPPSFFFGSSEFGMTADRVLYDGSESFTPPSIVERGHGADWMGVAIKEATVYFPPSVGHLSIGVRDLLLGHPFGLQLEVRVEFGYLNLETLSVTFTPEDGETALPASGTGQSRTVTLDGDSARVIGRASGDFLPAEDARTASGIWTLPEHDDATPETTTTATGLETAAFEVRPGDLVRFQARAMEGEEIAAQFPELLYRFEREEESEEGGSSTPRQAPQINLVAGGHTFSNALHLIGTAAQMNGVQLAAGVPEGEGGGLQWSSGDGRALGTGRTLAGNTLPTTPGQHALILRDPEANRTRRLLLEVLESAGQLLIGTAAGVFNGENTPVAITSVRSLYDLEAFHASGARTTVEGERPAVSGGTISVAEGQIAVAVVEARESAPPVQPPPPPEMLAIGDSAAMVFGRAEFLSGEIRGLEDFLRDHRDTPDAQVIVVGRTDDLWQANTDLDRRRERNAQLAVDRAQLVRDEVVRILGGEAAAVGRVFARGEQSAAWIGASPPGAVLDRFSPSDRARITTAMWAIENDHPDFVASSANLLPETPPRPSYRVVEVWLVRPAGAPAPANGAGDPPITSASHREVLVPGPDRAAPPPAERPRDTTQADPRGWRFRLIVKWDSPTLVSLADGIPTLAEILIEWEGDQLSLPTGPGTPVNVPFSRREVFAITGRWAHDPRSGEMLFSVRVESRNDPDGLFPTIDVPALAAVFGFGPALLAAIDPPEPGTALVAIGALFVAAGFLTERLPGMEQPIIPDGKIAIRAIQAEQRFFTGESVEESRTRVMVDYSVEMGFAIDSSLLGINTDPEKPIRVKYKNVGFELKYRREGGIWSFDGVYEDVSFEIEDPGQWAISGPMGELLRVTGSRAGTGSSWFEFDLAFSIDLGVVSLTNAIVRLIFPAGGGAPDVELRGLGVGINIPGVLEGAGRLQFGAGGDVRGAIEARIVPAKLQVVGAIAIQVIEDEDFTFVFVQVGVLFPVGIPLAQSGMAIYGLVGRFVSNGARALPAEEDPIEREIKWHALAPESKYGPRGGQWALGLGAVIGTMPDTGFSFNALGMFTISFPEISVVFGIDATFMSLPSVASEQRESTAGTDFSLKLLGIVAIDQQSVKIGIRGSFEIPEVLKLLVPISAYFPISKTSALPFDAYVRIGSDGYRPPSADLGYPRLGDTVTLQFLPSTLDVRVWAYTMFEEKRLYALGGDTRFDFTGFSIGFGAGFGIEWGGGPVRLAASAKILIGVGTKPLTMVGGIFVRGELWLVIVGISVSGELLLKLSEREQRVTGQFCGEVSFFFFSVRGCVRFELGTEPDLDIPFPGLLVPKLDLTDRRGVITGTLEAPPTVPPSPAVPSEVPVVWPDTVPLLSFQHHLRSALDAATNVTRSGQPPTAPLWTGTSELKYTFRLTGVELWKQGGGGFEKLEPTLPAAWWWPTHRPGVLAPIDGTEPGPPSPSEHEGRQLALLTWQPAAWAHSLSDGGAGTAGDPAETLGRLCDPAPPLRPVCVRGRNAQRLGHDRVRLRPDGRGDPPYFDTFDVIGTEMLGTLDLETCAALLDELGLYLVAGRPIAIANPIAGGGAYELTSVYRYMRFFSTAVFRARFSTTVVEPTLLLALGRGRMQEGGGGGGERACVTFERARPVNEPAATLKHQGLVFTAPGGGISFGQSFMTSESGVRVPVQEVTVELPRDCRFVSVRINIKGAARLKCEALDVSGAVVGAEGGSYRTEHTFRFEGERIRYVRLRGRRGQPVTILEVCHESAEGQPEERYDDLPNFYPAALLEGRYDDLFNRRPARDLPPVIGILPDNSESEWKGAVVAQDDEYVYVEYQAPSAPAWKGFRIEAWTRSRVAIVRACANTTQARHQQESDQENRDEQLVLINGLFASTDPLANRYLLERDRLYQIRVRWQWAGWRKTEDEPEPPDPLAGEFEPRWQPELTQYFYFRTAAETPALEAPPPADLLDERSFDPRGALRYFLGFEVAAQPDTHLLADPIRAHMRVRHLAQLMELYGYELKLEIRRTDMPPGTRVPGPAMEPLEAPFTLVWKALDVGLLDALDQRLVEAAEIAPCLDGYPADGATGEIDAELLPNAEYDLLLLAKRGDGELVIARTHFYTSRYAGAAAILAALGFPTSGPPSFEPVQDLVVEAALPSDTALGDDAALDAALRATGLDPFPLAAGPRLSLLWQSSGGAWTLAGVLVESDEPLRRLRPRLLNDPRPPEERLSVRDMQVRAGATVLATCTPIRSNATSTRVLLRPTSTLAASDLVGTGGLALALRLRDNGTIVSGLRALAGAPIFMAEVE